jgi:hypothetical protein
MRDELVSKGRWQVWAANSSLGVVVVIAVVERETLRLELPRDDVG